MKATPTQVLSFSNSYKVDVSEENLEEIHRKILKIMCPSKNAPYKEQIGYYNYYCQYFYTEEEEHKVDAWKGMIESVSNFKDFKGFSKKSGGFLEI